MSVHTPPPPSLLGTNTKAQDAMRYTYQTPTVKSFVMPDTTASLKEPIVAAHVAVPGPHAETLQAL
jgi:hypothetical protein